MKLAVCGASGLVGKALCNLLEEKKIPFVGTYNSSKDFENKKNFFKIDFSNESKIEKFLLDNEVTTVCFLVVQRLVDVCEENWNEIKKVNIDYVNIASYVCAKLGIKFIHLSTDYVFDGSKPPYYPHTGKNPLQNYGISKLISELKVKINCQDFCIIRTPVLYCPTNNILDNAVTMLGKKVMDSTKQTKEDNYSLRRPLFVPDLCNFILHCAEEDLRGTYHFFNPFHKFTKFEMCNIIGRYLEKNTSHILPDNNKITGIASRPYDTQLKDEKIKIEDFSFTEFNKTIEICFSKFKHKKINNELKPSDIFFLFDLDGTLLQTDKAHFDSYNDALYRLNKQPLDYNKFIDEVNKNTFKNYLYSNYNLTSVEYNDIKILKEKYLKNLSEIKFIAGADKLLKLIIQNNLNYCIVTNTTRSTVDIFKSKNTLFSKLNNIITGDDIVKKKPDPECYLLAIKKYFNNEEVIVGFENTIAGMKSLKHVTTKSYFVICDENKSLYKDFTREDGYIIDNFNQVIEE